MDKAQVFAFFLKVLDQAWQTTLGPAVVYGVTWTVNKWKGYVPRELQIPLAAVFAAIGSALVDGNAAVSLGTAALAQGALSINAKSVLASAKEV